MIFSGIPRVRLLEEPTSLERLDRAGEALGHRGFYVKRDDCMPLGMGGNKVRSLEFWLGQALAQGADVVVVAGAPASNQCRLTAAACAKLGLDCVVLHSSAEVEDPQGNALLDRLMGVPTVWLGPVREEERGRLAAEYLESLRKKGRKPYLVASDPPRGALGYVRALLELHEQAEHLGVDLRHVVVAGSMGTTEAGLLHGCALMGGLTLHALSVEYPSEELRRRILGIHEGVCDLLGRQDFRERARGCLRLYEDYLGEGYDVPTKASMEAVRFFARQEALFLDNTYTAKVFAGAADLVRRGVIPRGEGLCVFHTGGIPNLFEQARLFHGAVPRLDPPSV